MAVDNNTDHDIKEDLIALRGERDKVVKVSEISSVVETIMASMKGDLTASDLELYSELQALANYIHDAKSDIAALRPDEVRDEYLPTASDELDAIVQATETATNTIMDATEQVEAVMEGLDEDQADKLMEATTAIYEACGFQDITGQRITKVVKALKDIEDKIDALVTAFGSEIDKVKESMPKEEKRPDESVSDGDLLGGPQMSDEASTQDEIDALLASFD